MRCHPSFSMIFSSLGSVFTVPAKDEGVRFKGRLQRGGRESQGVAARGSRLRVRGQKREHERLSSARRKSIQLGERMIKHKQTFFEVQYIKAE